MLGARRRPDRGATTSRCRDIGEEEQQRDGPVPPQPFGRMGVAGDLFVVRRRRCLCIASSSLRDLSSQNPSPYVTVFMKGSTKGHSEKFEVNSKPTGVSPQSRQLPAGSRRYFPDLDAFFSHVLLLRLPVTPIRGVTKTPTRQPSLRSIRVCRYLSFPMLAICELLLQVCPSLCRMQIAGTDPHCSPPDRSCLQGQKRLLSS